MVPNHCETLGSTLEHTGLSATPLWSKKPDGQVIRPWHQVCLSEGRVPLDESSVNAIPWFGPPVTQQLEGGHLFRSEVPSQEVHGVLGEVRGND